MCLVNIVCRFRLYTVVYIAQSCVPDCSRLVPSTYFSRKREREKERGRGQYSRGPCRSFTRITQRRVEFVNDLATLRSNNLQKSASLKSSHTTKQKNEAFVAPNRPFPQPKNELEKKLSSHLVPFGVVWLWSGVAVLVSVISTFLIHRNELPEHGGVVLLRSRVAAF